MGFYDGIEKEDAANDLGAFMRAGHYLAMLTRVRSGTSKKHSCDYVAFDMRVLHVYVDGDTPMVIKEGGTGNKDWTPDTKGQHYAGEEVSAQFLGKFVSAKRNAKAFFANAVGVVESEVTPDFCALIEKDELLSGEILEMKNRMIEKKDGGPFTKIWVVRAVESEEFSKVIDPAVLARYLQATN